MDLVPARLLPWFALRRRDLPWRAGHGAWGIWVSEIMLQQTRVEVVVPFFERFLERFPTIESLAQSDIEEVLQFWAGLGYYRRARMLHAAAKRVHDDLQGVIPTDLDGLLALPGVGPYTAAAIGSLAFGLHAPVVDGNVKRVVARVCALHLASDDRALHRESESVGTRWMSLLPRNEAPGALNEAVMELGATVCTPKLPKCTECPLAEGYLALVNGDVLRYPRAKKAKAFVEMALFFFVLKQGDAYLLSKRRNGWNIGLYEPPCVPEEEHESLDAAWHSLSLGSAKLKVLGGSIRHAITHHKISAQVIEVTEWQLPSDLPAFAFALPGDVPLTGLARKVVKHASK